MPPIRKILSHVRAQPRLVFALGAAVGVWVLLLPAALSPLSRILLGWDTGAGLYLGLCAAMMAATAPEAIMRRARGTDENRWAIVAVTLIAPVMALVAIALELGGIKDLPAGRQGPHLILAILTILASWFFTHTLFAVHYAHAYYARTGTDPALQFPGEARPNYWDFMYFSFVIGTTSQTSDVGIADPGLRRVVLAHSVLTFFFNTSILALGINITANLL